MSRSMGSCKIALQNDELQGELDGNNPPDKTHILKRNYGSIIPLLVHLKLYYAIQSAKKTILKNKYIKN